MGQAKRKQARAAALAAQVADVDLAPLTNPEVRAAVLERMIQKGVPLAATGPAMPHEFEPVCVMCYRNQHGPCPDAQACKHCPIPRSEHA